MTLPPNPTLSWLLSFWFAVSAMIGLLATSVAIAVLSPWWALAVLPLAAVTAGAGALRPSFIARPYRAWNDAAATYKRWLRECIVGVCYFTIFLGVSVTRSKLQLASPSTAESQWRRRPPLVIETCFGAGEKASAARRVSRFLAWTGRSGNLWAGALLPYVVLLMALEVEESAEMPSSRLYTLY